MEFSGKPSQVRKLMYEHVFGMRWRQQQTQRLSEKFYNFTFVRVCTWWRTLQRIRRIKWQFVLSAQCYYWAEIRRVCVWFLLISVSCHVCFGIYWSWFFFMYTIHTFTRQTAQFYRRIYGFSFSFWVQLNFQFSSKQKIIWRLKSLNHNIQRWYDTRNQYVSQFVSHVVHVGFCSIFFAHRECVGIHSNVLMFGVTNVDS